jgi:predicted O-methyltransferase YrrM
MSASPTQVVSFQDYSYNCQARWGYGQPSNPHIARVLRERQDGYIPMLEAMIAEQAGLAGIAMTAPPGPAPQDPHWQNEWFSGFDAASLYTILARDRPKIYLEVGSGNSTLFASRSIKDHGLKTQIVSVDPQPRADIDTICDHCVRSRFEDTPVKLYAALEPGDVLFIDNSHRALQNSDVTAFFLDVLPVLKPGVIFGLHDIFLPDDYPPGWEGRGYSEQYMLASWLLAGAPFDILFPAYFVATSPDFTALTTRLFDHPALAAAPRSGGIFWMRTR